jgi:putative CocE/NonD family hydrolase
MDQSLRVQKSVRVPMRDGVGLSTNVFLPGTGTSFPVVLVRTAYNKHGIGPREWVNRGLAVVAQDCRGRYDSEGVWYPFVNEGQDGFDTLEWIGAQPWCNGSIGMFGDSYLAATQFSVAPEGSRFLKALNPRFMAGDCWKRAYYCDGAFSLGLTWSWLCFECAAPTSSAALLPLFDVPSLLHTLPLLTLDERSGCVTEPAAYRDCLRHAHYDAFWEQFNFRARLDGATPPTLLIGGWYDYYAAETFANYQRLRDTATSAARRDSHRVLIGPWTHGISGSSGLGQLDFGSTALAENDATLRWLDGLLHGRAPADCQSAPIRIFVMGTNVWRDEQEWPLQRAQSTTWYLHSGGSANSRLGDGALSRTAPTAEPPDHYTYDPDQPVPTLGGNHSIGPYNPGLYEMAPPGPFDQGPIERRDDVLVYTSAPLAADTEVTGPVSVTLWAATSAPDTDFVARLVDVYPDGRAINITEGIIRARFRESVWGLPQPIEPGQSLPYTIDLQATSNVFRQGHCLRLDITSSSFPLWDRNLNTGAAPGADVAARLAEQTILHDECHPSAIVLPIVPS